MKKRGKKRRSVGMVILVVFLILLIVLGAAAAAIYCVWKSYYGRSNYVSDNEFEIYQEIPKDDEEEAGEGTQEETLDPDTAKELEAKIVSAVAGHTVQDEDYVYNILLIGSDRRDSSWYGNSDSMILASVNTKAKKIYLTSFMRDLYAVIPGFGAQKLNAAYAHGAGPLLVQTIEENFKIDIDNWASVDFGSMETIINSIGGVDLELYQEEADYVNAGNPGEPQLSAGMMHLNGKQAVAFARIRYVGKYDYERTSRQRRVLEQMVQKLRGLSLTRLNQFVTDVLPLVTHNVSETELVAKIASLPEWLGYEIVQDRVPYDGLYSYLGEQLVPDYDATIARLKETIYATE